MNQLQKRMFKPNDEQLKYIEKQEGKIILNACPGSGKTSSIAYKLTQLIPLYSKESAYAGIACLSFTNTAKDEIEEKYKELTNLSIQYPNVVSTIDSFINNYITLPFFHKWMKLNFRPSIVENSYLADCYCSDLYNNSKPKYVNEKNQPLQKIFPLDSVEWDIDGTFYAYSFGNKKKDINQDYCRTIKVWQCKNGFIKTSDSAYIALKILQTFPNVAKNLVTRFPHIIIDEAQDTSEIQHAIIQKLIDSGLKNIEFIGDPYQSLYEWRDAKPELFFEKLKDVSYSKFEFLKSNRSHQVIIDAYSLLRKVDDSKITSATTDEIMPINIYRYKDSLESDIAKQWEANNKNHRDKCIIVRSQALKSHLLGETISDKNPWKGIVPFRIIQAKRFLDAKNIKESVRTIQKILPEIEGIKNSKRAFERYNEIKRDNVINASVLEFLKKLPLTSISLSDWSKEVASDINSIFGFEVDKLFEVKNGGTWRGVDKKTVDDALKLRVSEGVLSTEIATIHGVKGKTFDSILLFLNSTNSNNSITIDTITAADDLPDERHRMIYVAMSRPRYGLSLAIPEAITDEKLGEVFKSVQFVVK